MAPVLSRKRLPKARLLSLRSQYQASVRKRPCAVSRRIEWISLMKAGRGGGFIVAVRPNSCAAFKELLKSAPALARPTTCAPDPCACNRYDEKSDVASGTLTAPTTLPPEA